MFPGETQTHCPAFRPVTFLHFRVQQQKKQDPRGHNTAGLQAALSADCDDTFECNGFIRQLSPPVQNIVLKPFEMSRRFSRNCREQMI
jgi:hypothetical protein